MLQHTAGPTGSCRSLCSFLPLEGIHFPYKTSLAQSAGSRGAAAMPWVSCFLNSPLLVPCSVCRKKVTGRRRISGCGQAAGSWARLEADWSKRKIKQKSKTGNCLDGGCSAPSVSPYRPLPWISTHRWLSISSAGPLHPKIQEGFWFLGWKFGKDMRWGKRGNQL